MKGGAGVRPERPLCAEGHHGTHRCNRAGGRHRRHLGRAPARQAGSWAWRWWTGGRRARRPPTAMPASSRATRSFRRPFRRASRRCCASRSSALRKRTIICAICRRWCRGSWPSGPRRVRDGWSRPRASCVRCLPARCRSTRPCWRMPAPAAICAGRVGSSSIAATRRSPRLSPSSSWPPNSALPVASSIATRPAPSSPHLAPVFRHAVHWPGAASVSNPLAVTKAYAARLGKLGGVVLTGNARSLHRADGRWRIDSAEGPIDAPEVVLALGPFAPDILAPLGIRLPLGIKRGYHLHFRTGGQAALTRPIVDVENGYCLAPMEQGIRLTTGAEFAARAAPPTPVQLDRLLPQARALFALAEPVEATPWMGCRPCFADSRPVIGRAREACRPVARLWAWPLGTHARPRHRPAPGRDDDGRDAVLRSRALRGGAFQQALIGKLIGLGRAARSIGSCAPRPRSACW